MHLQVSTSTVESATVVAAIGELDLHTAPDLDRALKQATQDQASLLVVDEVHASDAYMTRLSEHLLRAHVAARHEYEHVAHPGPDRAGPGRPAGGGQRSAASRGGRG